MFHFVMNATLLISSGLSNGVFNLIFHLADFSEEIMYVHKHSVDDKCLVMTK